MSKSPVPDRPETDPPAASQRQLNPSFSSDSMNLDLQINTRQADRVPFPLPSEGRLQAGLQKAIHKFDSMTVNGWRKLLLQIVQIIVDQAVTWMAASITFYLLFAIFPFILFVVSLLGALGGDWLQDIQTSITQGMVLPEAVTTILQQVISGVREEPSVSVFSLGIITLIWSASRGFAMIYRSMSIIYKENHQPSPYLTRRLLSFVGTILAGLGIIILMMIMAFGHTVLTQLSKIEIPVLPNIALANHLQLLAGLLVLWLIFAIIYFISSGRRGRFRQALIAGAITSVVWTAGSALFSAFLSREDFLTVYGSLANLLVLMIWLYLCCLMLLIGAVIHAVLVQNYDQWNLR